MRTGEKKTVIFQLSLLPVFLFRFYPFTPFRVLT
jgi:hypothetical protein